MPDLDALGGAARSASQGSPASHGSLGSRASDPSEGDHFEQQLSAHAASGQPATSHDSDLAEQLANVHMTTGSPEHGPRMTNLGPLPAQQLHLDQEQAAGSRRRSSVEGNAAPAAPANRSELSSQQREQLDANARNVTSRVNDLSAAAPQLSPTEFQQRFDSIHEDVEDGLSRNDPLGSGEVGLNEQGYRNGMDALGRLHASRSGPTTDDHQNLAPLGAGGIAFNRAARSVISSVTQGNDLDSAVSRATSAHGLTSQQARQLDRIARPAADGTMPEADQAELIDATHRVNDGADPEQAGRRILDPTAFGSLVEHAAGRNAPRADGPTMERALDRVMDGDDPRDVARDEGIPNSHDRFILEDGARTREAIGDMEEGHHDDPELAIAEHNVRLPVNMDMVHDSRPMESSDDEAD